MKTDKGARELIRKVWFNSGRTIKTLFETDDNTEYDNSIDLNRNFTSDTSIYSRSKIRGFYKKQTWLYGIEKIIKSWRCIVNIWL